MQRKSAASIKQAAQYCVKLFDAASLAPSRFPGFPHHVFSMSKQPGGHKKSAPESAFFVTSITSA
jgi:hypothetical protein